MNDSKLWKIFSIYIRLRDSDEYGYGYCFTCGSPRHWKTGDAGHGIGRQYKATKYNEKNVHFQCKYCNGFNEGRKDVYKEKVNQIYGPGTWEAMEVASRQPFRWTQFEIDALEKHYKEQVKILLSKKEFISL